MELTLAALDAAFREWASGRAQNQPRRRVAGGTVLATMSAALPSRGLIGFKAYTILAGSSSSLPSLAPASGSKLIAEEEKPGDGEGPPKP